MAWDIIVKEIRRLNTEEGLNDKEIAKLIGCSRAMVNKERIKNNIPLTDLSNKKDKSYICNRCKKEIFIRRKERRKLYCEECIKLQK